jgi:archaeosine synthase beta-subunit
MREINNNLFKYSSKTTLDEAKKKVLALTRLIRHSIPSTNGILDLDRVSVSEVKEGFLNGEPIKRVIIILRARGCAWSLREDGGCSICGHICGTTLGEPIPPEKIISQLETELAHYGNFEDYPMLCLYNSGSFLNNDEIPTDVRKNIMRKINNIKGLKRLIIESRPEYITDEILNELEILTDNIEVEIGIGLETGNDLVRDVCINKGFTSEDFISVSRRLKKRKIKLLAYVLLKPPFLTEREGIMDTVETIKFAFNNGADIVSIEPVSVQDFTLTSFLYEAGYFRPPWIWSVMEVIKQTHNLGLVRLGGFEFFPIPKIFTHNCEECDPRVIKSIKDFNRTYDITVFNDVYPCNCDKYWKRDLSEPSDYIDSRILEILGKVDTENIINLMKMKYDIRGIAPEELKMLLFRSCSTPNL